LWGENTCTCLKMEDYWQRWNTTLKNNSAFSNVIKVLRSLCLNIKKKWEALLVDCPKQTGTVEER